MYVEVVGSNLNSAAYAFQDAVLTWVLSSLGSADASQDRF